MVIDSLMMFSDKQSVATGTSQNMIDFGQKDPQVVTWNDDSHVLPFDATIDFRQVGDTLKRSSYQGTITLEVFRTHCHDLKWYEDYTLESFYKDAHDRAVHVARQCD